MSIVIDASVIIAVIANEPAKDALVAATKGESLIAPGSIHWEIGNAFSAMLKRKRITLAQAIGAIEAYDAIDIQFVDVGLGASLQVAAQAGIYAYDAYLIQCALDYECPLISLDKNLVECAKSLGVSVIEVKA